MMKMNYDNTTLNIAIFLKLQNIKQGINMEFIQSSTFNLEKKAVLGMSGCRLHLMLCICYVHVEMDELGGVACPRFKMYLNGIYNTIYR